MSKVELPHGAVIDVEQGLVALPLGNVTLTFTLEEWATFFTMIDDLNTVIQTNTVESLHQCGSCGTVTAFLDYEEPDEQELN